MDTATIRLFSERGKTGVWKWDKQLEEEQ
jgi:hypothetical protein